MFDKLPTFYEVYVAFASQPLLLQVLEAALAIGMFVYLGGCGDKKVPKQSKGCGITFDLFVLFLVLLIDSLCVYLYLTFDLNMPEQMALFSGTALLNALVFTYWVKSKNVTNDILK